MLMALDDSGPYEMPNDMFDANGALIPRVVHRWHIVLLRDVLYWFRHDYFATAELLQDVP